jgi:hypothetical protein
MAGFRSISWKLVGKERKRMGRGEKGRRVSDPPPTGKVIIP